MSHSRAKRAAGGGSPYGKTSVSAVGAGALDGPAPRGHGKRIATPNPSVTAALRLPRHLPFQGRQGRRRKAPLA